MDALAALTAGGYVGREDGVALGHAYRFLRAVEHRLQLQRLRRTHTVPDGKTPEGAAALRWLAQALGFRADARRDAVESFRAEWVTHAQEVRRLHTKLVYRPLVEAVARVPSEALRLTPEAARSRLEILGFTDPAGALRHLEALTGGVSRYAAIQHTLLPVLLNELADAPEPDRGLLGYRQVSDALRRHAVVPAPAARRGHRGAAAGPAARPVPVRHRPAGARSRGAAAARRRRRAGAPYAWFPCGRI